MEINDIQNAISVKLHEAFGADYKKYIDEVPQGFVTPAFFIQFLNLEQIRQIGKRWKITTLFDVQYFPKNGLSEASNMTLKIQQAIKEITLLNGSLMLGTGANSEVVDGIGHNFIHFNFFLQEVEEKIFMGSLEQYINKQRVIPNGDK
ncbi:phage tail terminator family protein [Lysinibacillus sp. FSL M8-0134]|uniref:phage tail terminator family protein n=1 Tax=Lysinibacillus sp. FSL M8-0134 TaxID=2921717 RepID=UPI003119697A